MSNLRIQDGKAGESSWIKGKPELWAIWSENRSQYPPPVQRERERKWSLTSRYYLEVPTSCPLSENEGIVHYLVGHKCPVLTKDAPTNLSPEIRKTAEVWPVHLHFQNWPRLKAQPLFPYDTWDPPLYSPIHTPFLAHMMIPNIHRQVWTLPTPSAISNPTGGWKQWHMPIIPALGKCR